MCVCPPNIHGPFISNLPHLSPSVTKPAPEPEEKRKKIKVDLPSYFNTFAYFPAKESNPGTSVSVYRRFQPRWLLHCKPQERRLLWRRPIGKLAPEEPLCGLGSEGAPLTISRQDATLIYLLAAGGNNAENLWRNKSYWFDLAVRCLSFVFGRSLHRNGILTQLSNLASEGESGWAQGCISLAGFSVGDRKPEAGPFQPSFGGALTFCRHSASRN